MAYCTQCNKPLRSGAKFCLNCGAVVDKRENKRQVKEEKKQHIKSSGTSSKRRQSQIANTPRKPVNRRALIIKAAAKGLVKSLAISTAVLGPGMVLLSLGYQLLGMIWLFLGSFGLMAWTYRKPWRLGLISCLIPPLAAILCYLVQLWLFESASPPLLLLGAAIIIGLGVGFWRSQTHEVTRAEDGGIIAQRTIGYLLAWVAAYGITQMLGLMTASTYAVRAGLVTGAFSTAMLGVVSLVIWRQYKALQVMAVVLMLFVLWAPSKLYAASPDQFNRTTGVCKYLDRSWIEETRNVVVPLGFRAMHTDPFNLNDDRINYYGDEYFVNCPWFGGTCFMTLYFGTFDQYHIEVKLALTEINWNKPDLDNQYKGSDLYVNGINSKTNCSYKYYTYSKGGIYYNQDYSGFGQLNCTKGSYHIEYKVEVKDLENGRVGREHHPESLAREIAVKLTTKLAARLPNDTPPPGPDGNEEGSGVSPEAAATVVAAVSIVLVAAGIAVTVAQAIAAALAQAVQAGVEFTSEEIQNVIADAQLQSMPEPGDQDTPPENIPEPPTPPPIRIPGEKVFNTNEHGQYQAPDENGKWRWMSREEAIESAKAMWKEEAGKEIERAHHADETGKNLDKDRHDTQERYARERAEEWRKLAEQKAASETLERIEKAAIRTGDSDILLRTGEERVFKEDGSIDTDYLERVRKALRDRIGRDVAMPDSELEDNSTSRIIREGLDGSMDDATNSLVVRVAAGMASWGTSEIAFQGRTMWNTVKKAAEEAEDRGVKLSSTDVAKIVSERIVKDNLPVNTLDALNRMRKGEDVSLSEIAISMVADGFSAAEVAQSLKVKPGEALEGLGRRVLSEDAMTKIGKVKSDVTIGVDTITRTAKKWGDKANEGFDAAIDSAFKKAGVERNPLSRLSADHAAVRLEKGRLRPETEELIERMRGERSPAIAHADANFEAGRARGRQRIDSLSKSLDELDNAKKAGSATSEEIARLEKNVRDDIIRVQADKHAMNEMNKLPKDASGSNSTISEFNGEIKKIYDQADQRVINRLADEYGVRPEDIQPVTIENKPVEAGGNKVEPSAPVRDHYGHASPWKGDGSIGPTSAARSTPGTIDGPGTGRLPDAKAKSPNGAKVSFDRDLTMRVRTIENGRVVYKDIPSTTTARIYNEEFYKAATGKTLPTERGPGYADLSAGGTREIGNSVDFKDTHLSADDHLADVLDINDPDIFARRTDQATTDRLHPEAYGTGQADLDAATKDSFRGRDLTDATGTAKTVEYKVDHWINEADSLNEMASKSRDPIAQYRLREQATAHLEEGQRQLVKQYGNMAIKRTQAMQMIGNAPSAKIPQSLSERIGVLRRTQMPLESGGLTPVQAEAVLKKMGTNTRQVSGQLSSYVEGLQTLRSSTPKPPTSIVFQGWQDDFKTKQEG